MGTLFIQNLCSASAGKFFSFFKNYLLENSLESILKRKFWMGMLMTTLKYF